MRRLLAISCLALVWSLAAIASANEPAPVEFEWRAPDECPDDAAIRRMIEHHLGRSLDVAHSQPLSIAATVEPETKGRWRVRVVATTESGERERVVQPDGDCLRAAKAAALIVALTIDPTATPATDDPDPEPTPEPAPNEGDGDDEPRSAPTPAPPEPASPELRTAIGGFGAVGFGVLPGFDGGVGGNVGLLGRRWRVELVGGHWWSPTLSLAATADARFRAWVIGARGCGVVATRSPIEIPLCAGAELGQVLVGSAGLENSRDVRSLWAAAVIAPSLALVLHPRVALLFGADGLVPLRRPEYTVGGAGTVHRSAPFALRGRLGVEVRLP